MATPPFNPNVPLATSSPSQDQPVLLANSQTWYQTWNADGVTAGSATNIGFSNQRTFVRRTVPPSANATNGQVFSQEDAAGIAQLFWIAAAQDGGGISQITSNTPSGSTAGSSGYYASTQVISGASCTVEQWFWILPGNLQVKIIRVSQQTAATASGVYQSFTYAGTGGVSSPFASQPITAFYSTSLSNVAIGGTGSITSYASSIPSSPSTTGAYINGAVVPVSLTLTNNPSYVTTLTVLGI